MVKVNACPEGEGRFMQKLCNYLKDDITQKTVIQNLQKHVCFALGECQSLRHDYPQCSNTKTENVELANSFNRQMVSFHMFIRLFDWPHYLIIMQ